MAQGRRVAIVTTATLAYTEADEDQIANYIETGNLASTGSQVMPYSPAVMAALAGVEP